MRCARNIFHPALISGSHSFLLLILDHIGKEGPSLYGAQVATGNVSFICMDINSHSRSVNREKAFMVFSLSQAEEKENSSAAFSVPLPFSSLSLVLHKNAV